ncbi:MAG: sulfatase family protein, partial [Planctomycetota bacterium]
GGGNTGRWIGSKGSFLEGGIRVPAILSYPRKLPKGTARHQAVTAMDWYPTVLELCGLEIPKDIELDGRSVLPLVQDESSPSRYAVMHWQWQKSWMVREGNWKLIVNGRHRIDGERVDPVHLASLTDEQPERMNHADKHPEVVERLRRLHNQWARAVAPEEAQ